MLPTREIADKLLAEAGVSNPGAWVKHSKNTAVCAEKIAVACALNAEKAYILGLLHDIGRRFGVKAFAHVPDGYYYMNELGYEEVAKICLTHSFHDKDIHSFVGEYDVSPKILAEMESALTSAVFDDYDRLVQLCDALAGADGVVNISARLADVERRRGFYPQAKKDGYFALKKYFEEKCGENIYKIVSDDESLWEC